VSQWQSNDRNKARGYYRPLKSTELFPIALIDLLELPGLDLVIRHGGKETFLTAK